MATYNDDPMDVAGTVSLRPKTYFGQIHFDGFFCVLQKGVGKVLFDPQQHRLESRRTAITCEITPLASSGLQYVIKREMIAESPVWAKVVLPSIKALSLTPKEVNDRFVRVEMAPTGRKWSTDEGEQREETMPKLVAVFADEAECQRASAEFFGNYGGHDDAAETPAEPPAPPADPTRAALAAFLKPLWEQSGHEEPRFLEAIAANPLLAGQFNANSPEVLTVISL